MSDQPKVALLSKQQAAGLLNVSVKTLDRLRAEGQIEAVMVRSRVLFRPEAVAAYVTNNITK